MEPVPAGAARLPPVQVVAAFGVGSTSTPAGRMSLKTRLLASTALAELSMVNVNVLVPPDTIGSGAAGAPARHEPVMHVSAPRPTDPSDLGKTALVAVHQVEDRDQRSDRKLVAQAVLCRKDPHTTRLRQQASGQGR